MTRFGPTIFRDFSCEGCPMLLPKSIQVWCHLILCSTLAVVVLAWAAGAAAAPDAKLVAGPEECGECHKAEVSAWRETKHFKGFRDLTRSKEAAEISKKMGVRRLKSESLCMNCHFTSQTKGSRETSIAGVSCESCHSAAANWLKVHQDFGGKDVKKADEKPAHRSERLAKVKATGMIRPAEIYRLAANCFQCHTVPYEKLVNVGGHTPGSDFELVSWSQGEIRHNYTASQGKANAEASLERKRILFLVGKAVELEYNLRGVAKATEKADYGVKMARRAKAAMDAFKKISEVVPAPEVKEIVAISETVQLKLNNEKPLLEAADKIGRAAEKLSSNYDGSKWAALDAFIPGPDKSKGKPSK